jgi:hypothetical protein
VAAWAAAAAVSPAGKTTLALKQALDIQAREGADGPSLADFFAWRTRGSTMSSHDFRRFFLVALLLLAVSSPLCADTAAKPRPTVAVCCFSDTVLWADVWNLGHFFTSGGRARIVQVCVVAMCIALFIMMRKLNG